MELKRGFYNFACSMLLLYLFLCIFFSENEDFDMIDIYLR